LRLQPIYDIAEVCAQHGITSAIVCPGSRCAPLTLAFVRHPDITCRTFSDERSACFVALGIAQQTNMPVSLVCTSGSAAYNFAPAIAEAFYRETPLLVFTADRPVEWIDQWDGQTIRQNNIFGAHVKKSYTLPQEYDHPDASWHIQRIINEAITLCNEFPKGPIHINVPLREPLYPAKGETLTFSKLKRITRVTPAQAQLSEADRNSLGKSLSKYTRIMVVGGQQLPHEAQAKSIIRFCKSNRAVLVGDVISNLHYLPETIRYADSFLSQCGDAIKKSLAPELLITVGKSVISKNIKLFLRHYQPREHWHIQPQGTTADTFQSLTRLIHCSPHHFFEGQSNPEKQEPFHDQKKKNFIQLWHAEESRTRHSMKKYFRENRFTEFHTLKEIFDSLPARCNLHLSNSMSVRYANFLGLSEKNKGVHVFANRGTSGIDGCTSTAAGHAMTSDIPNILVTGDMAFFYDRNAFWHNYPLPNFHIILLNNHGGVIFNLIDGPGSLEEKDEYFITNQKLTASYLAEEFGHDYLRIDSYKKIKPALKDFFSFDGKTKILEVVGDQQTAKETFELFKDNIKRGYEA
jgi:2-succinyl-5-enolpyruvyl-6-hydroxy-3-cyclohexene-1-carboxylate synthase